ADRVSAPAVTPVAVDAAAVLAWLPACPVSVHVASTPVNACAQLDDGGASGIGVERGASAISSLSSASGVPRRGPGPPIAQAARPEMPAMTTANSMGRYSRVTRGPYRSRSPLATASSSRDGTR